MEKLGDDMYINISHVMSKSTGCNRNDHDYKPASKLMLKALSMKWSCINVQSRPERRYAYMLQKKKQKGPHPRYSGMERI